MKAKTWLLSWLIIVISALSVFGYWVYKVDPYFHYHKPELNDYFYVMDYQRGQNDGIIKHFDYDAIIIGTSMVENFRKTEVDSVFGCNSIKVPFSGGTYKEVNDNLSTALKVNPEVKIVIRVLDMGRFLDSWDAMKYEPNEYPLYLYDNNPVNDLEYLFNREIVFNRVYKMTLENDIEGFKPGITSFDDYSRWQSLFLWGIETVAPDGITTNNPAEIKHLSDEDKERITKNITVNVTNLADEYPYVEFYYFYSPYSIANWNTWKNQGSLYQFLEAEALITELIVPHENIHLFSINNRTDIITDLNNYKDAGHYACWINSLMLKYMHDGLYQLTEDNYRDYLKQVYDFFTTFDYPSANDQDDYEADFYAAALLNQELTGVKPMDVLNDKIVDVAINGADYLYDNGKVVVDCRGVLARNPEEENLMDYLKNKEYIGIKFTVNLDDGYNYLTFNGQKLSDNGMLTAYVYDSNGELIGKVEADCEDLDNEIHQYVIDLSMAHGTVTIVLNGGYIDYTGSGNSRYQFSNIFMY